MVGREHFDDPQKYWREIPWGMGRTDNIRRDLRGKSWMFGKDGHLEKLIEKDFPRVEGRQQSRLKLDENWTAVVIEREVGSAFERTEIPGLLEAVGGAYDWQEDLKLVEAYYLYNRRDGRLINLVDCAREMTGLEVVFFGKAVKFHSDGSMYLRLAKGEAYYYAIVGNCPRNKGDVLGLVHEMAHLFIAEKDFGQRKRLAQEADYLTGYREHLEIYHEILESNLTREDQERAIVGLEQKFTTSVFARRMVGAEMKLELETWITTVMLLEKFGLRSIFENGEELLDYIFWCVKTRLKMLELDGTPMM